MKEMMMELWSLRRTLISCTGCVLLSLYVVIKKSVARTLFVWQRVFLSCLGRIQLVLGELLNGWTQLCLLLLLVHSWRDAENAQCSSTVAGNTPLLCRKTPWCEILKLSHSGEALFGSWAHKDTTTYWGVGFQTKKHLGRVHSLPKLPHRQVFHQGYKKVNFSCQLFFYLLKNLLSCTSSCLLHILWNKGINGYFVSSNSASEMASVLLDGSQSPSILLMSQV